MAEREIAGVAYRLERMDAMKQFHVARRLAPVLQPLVAALPSTHIAPPSPEGADGTPAPDAPASPPDLDDYFANLGPLTEAIAQMPDKDVDYVIGTCLAAASRANPHGTGWSPVAAPNGRIMFKDIELPQMLQITWAVIQENLGGFFAAMPSISRSGAAQESPTE